MFKRVFQIAFIPELLDAAHLFIGRPLRAARQPKTLDVLSGGGVKWGSCLLLAVGLLLARPGNAIATPITINFSGLSENAQVAQYYDGGISSLGNGPGPNYGITFTPPANSLAAAKLLSRCWSLPASRGSFRFNTPNPM